MQPTERTGRLYVGCDLGVAFAKAAVLGDGGLLGAEVLPYSGFPQEAAMAAVDTAMARAGIVRGSVTRFLSTGFGGKAVPGSDGMVPDTVCLQRAARVLYSNVRMVINVGGHSCTVFHMDDAGGLGESPVTDMCTAGMGMLLEMVSAALELPLDGEAWEAGSPGKALFIDNQCPIFAESEAISLINEGHNRRDVAAGVASAVANKIAGLVRRLGIREEVAVAGGVAKNRRVMAILQRNLGLRFADLRGLDPQLAAAYGAALLAREGCSLDIERLSNTAAAHIRREGKQ